MIGKSISNGTRGTYGQSWSNWRTFCDEFGFDILRAYEEQLLIFYASWRFLSPKTIKANTIDKEISGILTTCGNITLQYAERKKMKILGRVMRGIKREIGRESTPVNPIRNKLLRQMISYLNDSFDDCVIKTFCLVAKFYMLRCGEYAIKGKPNFRTLRRRNISFKKLDGRLHMSLTLFVGKSNQFAKKEIVTMRCFCKHRTLFDLCPVHAMIEMLLRRGTVKSSDYLFVWEDGTILSTTEVSQNLYTLLSDCGIKDPKSDDAWRPHSFRYGGVTDLRAANVPDYLIRMMARHAPGSVITFHYTKFTAYEYSDKVYSHL